jgi:hypothetical protein
MQCSPISVLPRGYAELEHPASTLGGNCGKGPDPAIGMNSPRMAWGGNDWFACRGKLAQQCVSFLLGPGMTVAGERPTQAGGRMPQAVPKGPNI